MLPCGLVVANDCFAYFCGVAFGKRWIKAPFLALSPNKTWEGFMGGLVCTVIWGIWYADAISRANWLVCPAKDLHSRGGRTCEVPSLFRPQDIRIPTEDFAIVVLHAKPFLIHAVVLAL